MSGRIGASELRSGATNAELAAAFDKDLADSREIAILDFAKQPFTRRLGEASARLLSPLL